MEDKVEYILNRMNTKNPTELEKWNINEIKNGNKKIIELIYKTFKSLEEEYE